MFAKLYYAQRFFAHTYFPGVGAAGVTPPPVVEPAAVPVPVVPAPFSGGIAMGALKLREFEEAKRRFQRNQRLKAVKLGLKPPAEPSSEKLEIARLIDEAKALIARLELAAA